MTLHRQVWVATSLAYCAKTVVSDTRRTVECACTAMVTVTASRGPEEHARVQPVEVSLRCKASDNQLVETR